MTPQKADAEQLSKWYAGWLKACDAMLPQIRQFEAEGHKIKDAAEFREACLNVRSALSIPLDRLWDADESPGKPMAEVRNAVRRHLGTGKVAPMLPALQ